MGKFQRAKLPPSKTMNRKERRKEERKLKKARRNAFAHRNYDAIESLRNVDTALQAKRQEEKLERLKSKKKKKTVEKQEKKKEREDARIQGLKLAIQRDEKELKQLEKNLKFRKKKGKISLPSSFLNDGLDYILDATDSDKIKTIEDVAPGHIHDSDGSNSESDLEEFLGDDDVSDLDVKVSGTSWDPDAKAAKSILKEEKRKGKAQERKVKFAEVEEDNDEDVEETGRSVLDELEIEDDDDDDDGGDDMESDDQAENNEDVFSDSDEEEEEMTEPSRKRKRSESSQEPELREDIYGRLRDAEGNVVSSGNSGAYIPPAKRAMMAGGQNEILHKRLKGLVNKVSEGTIQAISSQVEALYLDHSRADVNETLTNLIMDAVVTPVLSPERLVAELAMLVTILHSNVGSEVGAFVIQKLAKKYNDLLHEPDYGNGKLMENVLLLLANIYNFRVTHSKLVFDIMEKFVQNFGERDIELLLFLLKSVGFTLRKDDPVRLKQMIVEIQSKARVAESSGVDTMQSRIRFMLDVLMAVRNNNMRKIPSYDPSHVEHLRKVIKNFMKGHGMGEDQLNISLEDLLKADSSGRWWIVGSAWEGRRDLVTSVKEAKLKTETSVVGTMSKQMLKLAKQQGMNTDIRRHIFCILGTSEDFEDAFARLLRLGLNHSQEREIIHVLFHCCVNEKEYNPFYGFLAQKFCTFDRRFTMTVQFSMWDKFKEVDVMDKATRSKLGELLSHLLISKSLSLSVFKVVEFGMESKKMIRLLAQVLTNVLSTSNQMTVTEIFERIAPFPKLKQLRQGLQVFMRVHLKDKGHAGADISLQERVEKAESAMFSHQSSSMLL